MNSGIDHENLPIEDAARWLVGHGPGQQALNECRHRFGVSASLLGELCTLAAEIRREGWEVSQ